MYFIIITDLNDDGKIDARDITNLIHLLTGEESANLRDQIQDISKRVKQIFTQWALNGITLGQRETDSNI